MQYEASQLNPAQTLQSGVQALAILQRFAFSLAAVPEEPLEAFQSEPIKVPKALAWVPKLEVGTPSPVQQAHLLEGVPQRSFMPADRESPDFVLEACHGLPSGEDVEITVRPAAKIAVVAHGEAEKIQAFTLPLEFHNSSLFPVYRQSQFMFKLLFEPVGDSPSHISCHDHKIIRVADKPGVGKVFGRGGIVFKGSVQLVKEDVGQQGRYYAALRSSPFGTFPRDVAVVVLFLDRAGEPQPDEPENRAVRHAALHLFHQPLVVDGVERSPHTIPTTTMIVRQYG